MCNYNERLRRGFDLLHAAHGDDTPLEFSPKDIEEMTPPTPLNIEDIPDIPTTTNIPDVDDERVNVLPVVVFVLSNDEYAALCAGDEN